MKGNIKIGSLAAVMALSSIALATHCFDETPSVRPHFQRATAPDDCVSASNGLGVVQPSDQPRPDITFLRSAPTFRVVFSSDARANFTCGSPEHSPPVLDQTCVLRI